MKYSVKTLLDVNETISHLFLDCIADSVNGTDAVSNITKKEGYNVDTSEVDIKLICDGVEVKIDNFLKHLDEEFYRLCDIKAQKIFEKQFPKVDWEDVEKMKEEIEDIVDKFKDKVYRNMTIG